MEINSYSVFMAVVLSSIASIIGEAVYLMKYKFMFGSNVFRFSDDYNGPLDKKWALIC